MKAEFSLRERKSSEQARQLEQLSSAKRTPHLKSTHRAGRFVRADADKRIARHAEHRGAPAAASVREAGAVNVKIRQQRARDRQRVRVVATCGRFELLAEREIRPRSRRRWVCDSDCELSDLQVRAMRSAVPGANWNSPAPLQFIIGRLLELESDFLPDDFSPAADCDLLESFAAAAVDTSAMQSTSSVASAAAFSIDDFNENGAALEVERELQRNIH